jgi:prefoldin subunit 5
MVSASGKIANELKTLMTYLTTTPAQQLDAGYIDSQAAYLARQVDALQSDGGSVSSAVGTFDTAIRRLDRLASSLAAKK